MADLDKVPERLTKKREVLMLPNGWARHKLGEIASFRNGLNYTRSDTGEAVKIVGVADFRDRGHLETTSQLATVQIGGALREDDLLRDGDLLFVRSNGKKELIGRCLFFPEVRERLTFSGFTIRGRVNTSVLDPLFASYLMRSSAVLDQIFLGGSGTNISNLSQEILANVSVHIPNLYEQRRVAEVLAIWDRSIVATERLLANSMNQKLLLAQQLLTGKSRLAGFTASGKRRDTPYGSLPLEWGYPRIGEVATEVSQKLGDGEPYPVLSCTKHRGLVDSLAYFNKQVFSVDTSTYKVVPHSCFVYATNHIDEGSIGYQDLYDFGLVSPMYTVFRTNDTVDDSYLFALLKTEHYRQIFASATNASVDRRGSLRWKDFRNLHIPLPPIKEQLAISTALGSAGREVALIQDQLRLLRDEKAALMTQLLTGKRRVKQPKAETEARE
ncbi:restriction endonuclease subunit S [Achromobacter animicus]